MSDRPLWTCPRCGRTFATSGAGPTSRTSAVSKGGGLLGPQCVARLPTDVAG